METFPSSRPRIILAAILAGFLCLFSAIAAPPSLRQLDVDKLAAQYFDKQEYFKRLDEATLAVYDRLNKKDDPWYENGRQAVRLWALATVWNDFYAQGIVETAQNHAKAATKSGCKDPLVISIDDVIFFARNFSRFSGPAQDNIRRTRALLESDYPAIYKLVTTGVALTHLSNTQRFRDSMTDDLAPSWAEIPRFTSEIGPLMETVIQEETPTDLIFYRTDDLLRRIQFGDCIEPVGNEIDAAFERARPDHPARAALRGVFYSAWAWNARGGEYAHTVTDEGWRLMEERLAKASEVLTEAWNKNPKDYLSATVMLTVELGQGHGRDVMEKWFVRATKDHPNHLKPWHTKMWYLQPRWYGSREDVIAFGNECVKTGNWAAKIPLTFQMAIGDLGDPGVYRDEEIWQTVSGAFEEFLKRYPDSTGVRTTYANYAAKGDRFDVVRAQLKELGPYWDRTVWSDSDYQRISKRAEEP